MDSQRFALAAVCSIARHPRRMWISSSLGWARLKSWFRRGISFPGHGRVEEADLDQRLFEMDQHAGDRRRRSSGATPRRERETAERLPPFIGDQLHCGGQVERTVVGRGRDLRATWRR